MPSGRRRTSSSGWSTTTTILRVVVAEEKDDRRSAPTRRHAPRLRSARRPRTSSRPRAAVAATVTPGSGPPRCHGRLDRAVAFLKGNEHPRASGLQNTTDFHDWLTGFRDWVQPPRHNRFFGSVHRPRSRTGSTRLRLVCSSWSASPPSLGRCPRSAGWRRGRSRPGSPGAVAWRIAPSPSPCSSSPSGSRALAGLIDLLLVTLLSVVFVASHRHAPRDRDRLGARWSAAVDHAVPRHDADHASLRLPDPDCALLRHRRDRGIVLTVIYALPPLIRITGTGSGPCPDTTIEADRSMGQTTLAAAAPGAAADGPQDHHRRDQPDHDGGAVHGHHRRAGQRARPGKARAAALQIQNIGARLGGRPAHRRDGDHAGPDHHRRQRTRRAGRASLGQRPG